MSISVLRPCLIIDCKTLVQVIRYWTTGHHAFNYFLFNLMLGVMQKYLLAVATVAQLGVAEVISGASFFVGGDSPVVETSYARFQGKDDVLTSTSNYLGISYAKAPRFDHSRISNTTLPGIQNVSDYGPACAQHDFISLVDTSALGLGSLTGYIEAGLAPAYKQAEECLFINIQRPINMTAREPLPVVLWIHGGGFEAGASTSFAGETTAVPGIFYQGAHLVQRSQEMNMAMVVVSINYRLASFGFSASREMADAGLLNLGFEDQRNAMRWVQQNIGAFGGDADKVTIMGESAGSWSVSAHLVANDGDNEGLFRGAVGISGGPLKVDGPERGQALFDEMVSEVGCAAATDKIACLRDVSFAAIYSHVQSVGFLLGYGSLASPWTLRPDGMLLTASPDKLIAQRKIANVPIMYGDMINEGTLFSLINSLNLTTEAEVVDYFGTLWWPNATDAQLAKLMELYPEDIEGTAGNAVIGPQFNRIAALTGDYSFQAQRRQLLNAVTAPKWNYLTEQTLPSAVLDGTSVIESLVADTNLTQIPVLGSFHASDVVLNWFGILPGATSDNSRHLMGVLIAFVNNLDPNGHGMDDVPYWPQYGAEKQMIRWSETDVRVIADDYREEAVAYINQIGDSLRI